MRESKSGIKEFQTSTLFARLGMAVLVRADGGSFKLIGDPPPWFYSLCPDCANEGPYFEAEEISPFLSAFLDGEEDVWSTESKTSEARHSRWWTHIESDDTVHFYMASAVNLVQKGFLVIHHQTGESPVFSALHRYKLASFELERLVRENERNKAELAELRELSVTDELTGLANERGFYSIAGGYLEAAKRKRLPLLAFSVSLDDLAHINEQYGHAEGSMSLIAVTDILKKTFSEASPIARLMGSEFVALTTETAYVNEHVLKDLLGKNLKEYNIACFKTYSISLSVGAARLGTETPSALKDAVAKASTLMRESRKHRKNNTLGRKG